MNINIFLLKKMFSLALYFSVNAWGAPSCLVSIPKLKVLLIYQNKQDIPYACFVVIVLTIQVYHILVQMNIARNFFFTESAQWANSVKNN